VRGFIIGNTWAWPHEHDLRIRTFSWIMGGPIGKALTYSFNFVPRFFFSRGFARPIGRTCAMRTWRPGATGPGAQPQ